MFSTIDRCQTVIHTYRGNDFCFAETKMIISGADVKKKSVTKPKVIHIGLNIVSCWLPCGYQFITIIVINLPTRHNNALTMILP